MGEVHKAKIADTEENSSPTLYQNSYKRLLDSLPWRFFRKLAVTQVATTALILITASWIAKSNLESYLINQAKENLNNSLNTIRQHILTQGISPIQWCQSLKYDKHNHYTLTDIQGQVLCDNHSKPESLENHLKYKEIADAARFGQGTVIRATSITQTRFFYSAITIESSLNDLNQKFIIRWAIPTAKLDSTLKRLDQAAFIFLLCLLLSISFVSLWSSLQVSFPLRSILRKIDGMKKITRSEDPFSQYASKDEWIIVEKTLDQAQRGFKKYIDELYNENEKMGTVMESISDSILAIGLDENILFANKQFKKNFLNKEIKRQDVSKFKIWEINRNIKVQDLFNETLTTAQSVRLGNMELPIKDGRRTSFFDIKINPLLDQKGKVFGAVGIFHDVTERKMAEQMREDFVVNVSHEVRTPLTAMKGFVQILKETPIEKMSEARSFLDKIELNSDRLTTLFNDILNLSVIESKNKVSKETVFLEELTLNVITNVRQSYPKKKINLKTHFEIEKIWANPPLLEQVMTNLIDNAYKYTPDTGSVSIKWTQETKKSSKNSIDVLTIQDTGIGIPKEHLPRVFERFYRVDPGRSRDIGGTGLGLAIVKHIVQTHSGQISVNSRIGKGSTFTVKLPAHY